jgi:hypothetical protein
VGRHVAPLGHIILIPSQPVFAIGIKQQSLTHSLTHSERQTIMDNMLEECHASCTLKTSFVDFEKEQVHRNTKFFLLYGFS